MIKLRKIQVQVLAICICAGLTLPWIVGILHLFFVSPRTIRSPFDIYDPIVIKNGLTSKYPEDREMALGGYDVKASRLTDADIADLLSYCDNSLEMSEAEIMNFARVVQYGPLKLEASIVERRIMVCRGEHVMGWPDPIQWSQFLDFVFSTRDARYSEVLEASEAESWSCDQLSERLEEILSDHK